MLSRILRSIVTLAALVVVYQTYVLTIGRLVEPPAIERSTKKLTEDQRKKSYNAIGRYQSLLAAYFPAGHWALTEPLPTVARIDKLMLVIKDYRRHDDGSVDVDECALLAMPADWEVGAAPPLEAVILEAPGGAHLQFDDDFQPSRGKAGRIVSGRIPGEIVIRSDMKLPGPDDDLYIATRDLTFNDPLIRTDAQVEARFGPHRGSGRRMQIRLGREEHIKRGPSINRADSLEILEDVQLTLYPGDFNLLGNEPSQDKTVNIGPTVGTKTITLTSANETVDAFQPPVTISCQNRFHFDLLNYIASFDHKVEVRRMRLGGSSDQLDCNELSIQFSPVDDNGVPIISDDPNLARRQREALRNSEPVRITATGYPVRADSAAEGASAHANRMEIDLIERSITLDQGEDVRLGYGPSEIHAQRIKYTMPDEESPRAVGKLSIDGSGWLRAVPDQERPDRVVDISWKTAPGVTTPVRLTRRGGQPVLLLEGQPVIDAHRLGKIGADRMELMLREVPADGPNGPAFEVSNKPGKLAIIPERLLAAGRVVFASPRLTGRTHQLEGDFEQWQPPVQGAVRPTGDRLDLNSAESQQPSAQYDLSANQIHLDLALSGKSADPTAVVCDGAVVLRETRTSKPGEQPLVVYGNQLTVRELNHAAKISVFGRRDPQLAGPGTATIEARGLRLAAERINADQASGKFWINGPGLATMNVEGQAFGEPPGTMVPVSLTWQTGLDAAGRQIKAVGRVLIESQHGWVQADAATALLTRPVTMERGATEGKIEVAQASLEGNVVGDHRGIDDTGQTSHERFQLKSIVYDRLSGNIKGRGPGVLRSVRLTNGEGSFADLAAAGSRQPSKPETSEEPSLRFLRIDFAEGLSGNTNQRVIRFHRRVQCVYGPVDDWQQELPLHAPDRLPVETVTLTCETLELNEDPLARRQPRTTDSKLGPIEIRAIDNVEIEGRSEANGVFQAQAAVASYIQSKDLFKLEGNGMQDAVIRNRDPVNGRYLVTPAEVIEYYRTLGKVKGTNGSGVEYEQTEPRSATRFGPIR